MVIMQFQVVRFVDLSEIMCKFLDCPASGMILMIMQSCIEMWQIQKELILTNIIQGWELILLLLQAERKIRIRVSAF